MKSYPYVGKFQYAVKLFYAPNKFELLEGGNGLSRHESNYTNITREYLQNTWGVVESKEHAEFIVELAKSAGLKFYIDSPEINKAFFAFNESSRLFFYDSEEGINKDRCKQITIPLPPKEPLKNAGDNLILGCDSQLPKSNVEAEMPSVKECKGDEWPQVGDEVVAYDIGFEREMTMIYRGKNKNNSSIVEFENGNVILLGFEGKIKKPKPPEEELRDELTDLAFNQFNDDSYDLTHNAYYLASSLIDKYNITKKPQ